MSKTICEWISINMGKEDKVSIPKEDLPKGGSKVIKDMIKRGGSGAGRMRGKNNRRPKDKKNDPTKSKD